jgi:hypothetical protein
MRNARSMEGSSSRIWRRRIRRVWQEERSEGEYVDWGELVKSETVGKEVAGGTIVVEDVADDSDVDEAERVEGAASVTLLSLAEGAR